MARSLLTKKLFSDRCFTIRFKCELLADAGRADRNSARVHRRQLGDGVSS